MTNEQSRDTDNIGQRTQNEDKQEHNTENLSNKDSDEQTGVNPGTCEW
jgi:hypothetical protein